MHSKFGTVILRPHLLFHFLLILSRFDTSCRFDFVIAAHIGQNGSCEHVTFISIIDHATVLIVDLVDDVSNGTFLIVAWFGDLFNVT